jgi:hypothetical protein
MTSTTDTNLLEAVNRVLLDVGERQVTTITNSASRKAKAYLQDAFRDMQDFHDWSWSYREFTAVSWDNEKAAYGKLKRVREVYWDTGSNNPRTRIDYVPVSTFELYSLESFNSTDNPNSKPLRYCILDEDTLKFNPYPTDVNAQTQIVVFGYEFFDPPETNDEKFDMPERFVSILVKRAVYMMLLRHLGDFNAAQLHQGEFELQLKYQKDKEFKMPTGGISMHRQGRRG